jgi:hypothetical protein
MDFNQPGLHNQFNHSMPMIQMQNQAQNKQPAVQLQKDQTVSQVGGTILNQNPKNHPPGYVTRMIHSSPSGTITFSHKLPTGDLENYSFTSTLSKGDLNQIRTSISSVTSYLTTRKPPKRRRNLEKSEQAQSNWQSALKNLESIENILATNIRDLDQAKEQDISDNFKRRKIDKSGYYLPSTDKISNVIACLDGFLSLVNDSKTSDVTLRVEDKNFYGHCAILSSRSDVLKTMLFGSFKEGQSSNLVLTIENCSAKAFGELLVYLYTGQITLQDETFIDSYVFADYYHLPDLEELCLNYLNKSLSLSNCVELLSQSFRKASFLKVHQEILSFVLGNAVGVFQSSNFYSLPFELFLELLKNDRLNAPEIEVFRAVISWVQKQSEEDQMKLFEQVKPHIRMNSIKMEDFWKEIITFTIQGESPYSQVELINISKQMVTSTAKPRELKNYCILSKFKEPFTVEYLGNDEAIVFWKINMNTLNHSLHSAALFTTSSIFPLNKVNWFLSTQLQEGRLGFQLNLDQNRLAIKSQIFKIEMELALIHQDCRKIISFSSKNLLFSFVPPNTEKVNEVNQTVAASWGNMNMCDANRLKEFMIAKHVFLQCKIKMLNNG